MSEYRLKRGQDRFLSRLFPSPKIHSIIRRYLTYAVEKVSLNKTSINKQSHFEVIIRVF